MPLGSIGKKPKQKVDPVTGEPVDDGVVVPFSPVEKPDPSAQVPIDPGTGGSYTTQPQKKTTDTTPPAAAPAQSSDYLDAVVKAVSAGAGPAPSAKLTPADIERMSIEVANETGAGQSSAENLADWNRKYAENNWTPEQLRAEMVRKALEPDTSQQGGNGSGFSFGPSSYAGFLGNSLVPTDAASTSALQAAIENILGGKGGLDIGRILGVANGGAANTASTASGQTETSSPFPSAAAAAVGSLASNPASLPPTITEPYILAPNPNAAGTADPGKVRDAMIASGLLGQTEGRPNFGPADTGSTVIPDRAGDAITSFFGLSPVMKGASYLEKLNHPGDIIFGNPPGGPQGPTDPNLKPMSPEERQRNAQIAAELLANNEANGGI